MFLKSSNYRSVTWKHEAWETALKSGAIKQNMTRHQLAQFRPFPAWGDNGVIMAQSAAAAPGVLNAPWLHSDK